jgi:hypothetical protein
VVRGQHAVGLQSDGCPGLHLENARWVSPEVALRAGIHPGGDAVDLVRILIKKLV